MVVASRRTKRRRSSKTRRLHLMEQLDRPEYFQSQITHLQKELNLVPPSDEETGEGLTHEQLQEERNRRDRIFQKRFKAINAIRQGFQFDRDSEQ